MQQVREGGVSSGSSVGQLLSDALDSKPSEFCVLIGTESHTTIVVQRCPLSEQGTCERVLTQRGCASETNHPRRAHLNIESAPETTPLWVGGGAAMPCAASAVRLSGAGGDHRRDGRGRPP